eukprot:CAMPEP_0119488184 /NCGR_PEP_ID=MMETSP1344-20130328/14043_1 /TAXON_ID=236787 /ORGANISM="Florenciella parvula, Strain CCMP2471" /LENGTH=188 /DNA_ID=CAMNT_0007523117 /DNA_START=24 /DNA_END=590 /DNA_ORIENTATION=+
MSIYSSHLRWVPQGDQEERFPEGIAPVHDDILLAKLRPGQSIKLEAHCQKGDGKNHAKFSPVATAAYRLMPHIKVVEPKDVDEAVEAAVAAPVLGASRPRDCSMLRPLKRNEEWHESVKLQRIADHFIFKVEAVGMLTPREIVSEAFRTIREKAESFTQALDKHEANVPGGVGQDFDEEEDDIEAMVS